MRRRRPAYEEKGVYINLGPMVDISLSLLIMFVLAIPFFIESGLFVSRGAATKGAKASVTKTEKDVKAYIYMKADGTILLNNEKVTMEQLDKLLPKLLARSVSRKVLLTADDEVIYDDVIHMIDFAKQKGAEDVVIIKRRKI